MNTYTLTPEERFNIILECRNSGLTDYQWCKQKGISTNTLYRWINKFRQNGYPNIPKEKGKSQIASAKQEVVKLDIVADIPCQGFKNNNGKLGHAVQQSVLQAPYRLLPSGASQAQILDDGRNSNPGAS